MTPKELAAQIAEMIMVRAGEVITQAVAQERANNIATGLAYLLEREGWISANREDLKPRVDHGLKEAPTK